MIEGYSPVVQAILASLFTWGVTALGSAVVFLMQRQSHKLLDSSLGFAAGVMTAASFWSLLSPAIDLCQEADWKGYAFVPVAIGFAVGAAFVHLADRLIPSCVLEHGGLNVVDVIGPSKTETELSLMGREEQPEEATAERYGMKLRRRQNPRGEALAVPVMGKARVADAETVDESQQVLKESWRRILLLIIAVTVHNIPEGMAVGVSFASIGKAKSATFDSAYNLALGIGLQNFPEGLAVSVPLAAFGHSKGMAFFYGQLSGMVEPLAAVAGAYLVLLFKPILPFALSFAAGAMIYVVVDDIIPEAQRHGNGKLASVGAIAGFIVMMSLDVGLG